MSIKKTTFIGLAYGAFLSVLVTSASASFSFSIDSFTTDELVVTISGAGTLSGPTPASNSFALFFADSDGSSSFLTSPASVTGSASPMGPTLTGSGATLTSAGGTGFFAGGNVVGLFFNSNALIGDTFGTDIEVTFSGIGLFDENAIGGDLGLYWGTGGGLSQTPNLGTLQDLQSVVPEPSIFTTGLGAMALLLTLVSRRRPRL